jgi:hypothetical protein
MLIVCVCITVPAVAQNLALDKATANSLKFKWEAPATGDITGYKIKILDGNSEIESKLTDKADEPTIEFNGLVAGKEYTAQVYTVFGTVESDKVELKIRTSTFDMFIIMMIYPSCVSALIS